MPQAAPTGPRRTPQTGGAPGPPWSGNRLGLCEKGTIKSCCYLPVRCHGFASLVLIGGAGSVVQAAGVTGSGPVYVGLRLVQGSTLAEDRRAVPCEPAPDAERPDVAG